MPSGLYWRAWKTIAAVSALIAKIHEDTVTHVSRHESIKPVHSFGDAFLTRKNDLAQVFRVHLGEECRRAN